MITVCSHTTTSDGPHYDHAYQDAGFLYANESMITVCSPTTTSDAPHYDHVHKDTGWL